MEARDLKDYQIGDTVIIRFYRRDLPKARSPIGGRITRKDSRGFGYLEVEENDQYKTRLKIAYPVIRRIEAVVG